MRKFGTFCKEKKIEESSIADSVYWERCDTLVEVNDNSMIMQFFHQLDLFRGFLMVVLYCSHDLKNPTP